MHLKRNLLITLSSVLLFSCTQVNTPNIGNSEPINETSKQSVLKPITRKSSDTKETAITQSKKQPIDAVAAANNEEFNWPAETEDEVAVHAAADNLDLSRPLIQAFVNKMVNQHGFKKKYIEETLSQAINKHSILKAISRPAEKSKEWFEYRQIFLTDKRITAGRDFIRTNADALQAAENKYGVPKEIISAIIGVETFYGRNSGKYKVLDSLVTLGFNYPPRAKFFRRELEQFFLLSREEQFEPTQVLGSYAGAMGNGQFISSSYRNYTADGDGDGKRDLWNSWPDAIFSVANYFSEHHWKTGEDILSIADIALGSELIFPESKVGLDAHTVGSLRNELGLIFNSKLPNDAPAMFLTMQQENSTEILVGFSNFYTITRYNRSPKYARAVYELSQEIAKTPTTTTN